MDQIVRSKKSLVGIQPREYDTLADPRRHFIVEYREKVN